MVAGSDDDNDVGTECRTRRCLDSDSERRLESRRRSENGRMDRTQSRSSPCGFDGASAKSQMGGIVSAIAPAEAG